MAYFQDGIQLTIQGKALNVKILANKIPFNVTAIGIGDGELNAQVDPNQLSNELFRTGNIKVRIHNSAVVIFEIDFSDFAAESNTAWQFREIGIFADDPDDGEILYAYANAGDGFDTIPPHGASTYLKRIVRLPVEVANAANIYIHVITNLKQ
jgi:hypothetical protein